MKTRCLALLMTCLLVASLLSTSVLAAPAFTDVDSSAYYAAPVSWAVEEGITTGKTDTTFAPNATCTRANIITFLWRAAGSPEPGIKHEYFQDVPMDAYYFKAANWSVEKGIISVNSANYEPNTPCTRGDAVLYIWRYAGRPAATEVAFQDVTAGTELSKAVSWAVGYGVTNGSNKEGTTFSPNDTCTRGNIVTFLHRYFVEPLEVKPVETTTAAPVLDEKLDPLPPKAVTQQPDWYMSLTAPGDMSNPRLVAEYQQILSLTSDDAYRTESVLVREGDLQREIDNRVRTIQRYEKFGYAPEAYQDLLDKGGLEALKPYL